MSAELRIRELAERTGVAEATLRVWETRHGFPEPQRLPSGHRRYSEDDVERVRQVARDRDAGLSLAAAIERARVSEPGRDVSIFAGLRRRRPDLIPYTLPKRILIALSHAIEDECCARAERPVLIASFQRVRFYRDAEARWRELARTAELAVVLADFDEVRDPGPDAPLEVPLDRADPLGREWSLVCDAPDYAACLSAWEPPGQDEVPDLERSFETIWTVEPELVRDAVRVGLELAARSVPEARERVSDRLEQTPPPSGDEFQLVATLANRMVAYVGNPALTGRVPPPHHT